MFIASLEPFSFLRESRLTSVPWITLQRDIHCGYPQVDLEAQLSTDIHRWMMWISTARYIGLWGRGNLSKAHAHCISKKSTDYISQSSSENTFSSAARPSFLRGAGAWEED
jgi:hypothetical protein